MSLRAKLEAVIYAAEEPVTLAQLAALFADEAIELKVRQAESTSQAAEADFASAGVQTAPLTNAELVHGGETGTVPAVSSESAEEPVDSESGPAGEGVSEAAAEPGDEAESDPATQGEARRLARERDREVRAVLRQLLDELIADYADKDRGIEIREIAGGYRMATKPEYHDAVRSFVKSLKPPLKLSLPALETLAVIAYKQPVTAPEVNEIRGVDSSAVFGSLLARKLIVTAGRKPVIGRPILYKTTREFLLRFGLKDVSELPSMEEFEKMAAMELDEPEMASETESSASAATKPDLNPELEFDPNADESPTGPSSPESEQTRAGADSASGPTAEELSPEEAEPAAISSIEQAETEMPQNDR